MGFRYYIKKAAVLISGFFYYLVETCCGVSGVIVLAIVRDATGISRQITPIMRLNLVSLTLLSLEPLIAVMTNILCFKFFYSMPRLF